MKACVGNKGEAENEEGITDKKEATETGLEKFFGRKMTKKEKEVPICAWYCYHRLFKI